MSKARKERKQAQDSIHATPRLRAVTPAAHEASTALQDTHEAKDTMSTTTAEMNTFIDQTRKMSAPFARIGELSAKNFEKLARYNYEVAGDWLNLSIAQLHAATQSKDVPELLKKHAELANNYFEKQTQRSQDLMKIASEAQADLTQLIDTTANDVSRSTRAAV